MSVSVEFLSIKNPGPRLSYGSGVVKRASSSSSMALCTSRTFRFQSSGFRVPIVARSFCTPKGLGFGFGFPDKRTSLNQSTIVFAASHEESKPSEVNIEKEADDMKTKAQESEEAWKETLASFKEQALRMKSVSQEAYETYSKKAAVVLQETAEQLKIQAEKASQDFSVIAKEISEESKEYLLTAAEKSPEPVKEIVKTYSSSTDELKDISKIRDFHFGIPYGLLLSVGGFLSFMVLGSVSAIRFGVILGGALLALSISSLRSYKGGETSAPALKGQAAIATIIFLREIRVLSQRMTLPNGLTTLISGAMVAFYVYLVVADGKLRKRSDWEHGAEN